MVQALERYTDPFPSPFLHLSYPRELARATIRHRARISVSVIASVSLDGKEDTAAAIISD